MFNDILSIIILYILYERILMYAYFRGELVERNEDSIVVDVNGIGYNIFMSGGKAFEIGAEGDMVKVYTYTAVREDAINLYGFISKEDLNLFKKLISVSGVGPKVAQGILSYFSADQLIMAISAEDSKAISKAPGVGKKTAERIIIDLKDKVEDIYSLSDVVAASLKPTGATGSRSDINDAVLALTTLGYSGVEAKAAVSKAAEAGVSGSDDLLKAALKYL